MTPPVGSLRLRLLLGAAVWILLALVMAGLVLAELFARHVQERFAVELGHHLDQLASSLRIDAEGKPELVRPLPDPRFSRPLSGLYWQVAVNGHPVLRSRSLWDQTLALPADASAGDGRVHEWRIAGPEHQSLFVLERSLLLPEGPESLQVVTAEDLNELTPALQAFNRTLALSLVALAAALVLAAVVQVALGLRPLAWLRDELTEIRSGRKRRFERPMPSEVRPLIDDLNALLHHSDEVVERARLQAGNLAHGLKTNLAALANEADQLTRADARLEEAKVANLILAQVATMRRHIDHHMARARAASRRLPGTATDVADCAAALVRVMRKVHAARDLAISTEVPAGLIFAGDRQDLEEMLGNLLDNACKWARRTVVVTAVKEGDQLIINVEDDGHGLAPEEMERALSPGMRLDESVPGTGLGLGVVRDLVTSYGGTLVLVQSDGTGGLRASLRLPDVS